MIKTIIISLIIIIIFSLISSYTDITHFDERNHHYPTTLLFYEKGIVNSIKSEKYNSASTPLPYALNSLIFKTLKVKPTIRELRIVNYLFSALTIILFIVLLKSIGGNLNIAYLLLLHPYYIKPTYLYFMSIYGLFFFLLFLIINKDDRNRNINIFLEGLFLTFSILSHQFYLAVIPCYYIWYYIKSHKYETQQVILKKFLLFSFPLLIIIILFIIWGGITHKSYKIHSIGFRLEYITVILITIGGQFFPILINIKIANWWKTLILFLLISIILVGIAYPNWSNIPKSGYVSGYIFKSIHIINYYNPFIALIVKIILLISGLLIIFSLVKEYEKDFIYFLFITFVIAFLFNNPPSERHFLPIITLIFLLISRNYRNSYLLKLWIMLQTAVGLIYFYYIFFLYSNTG